jgi:plastocyanin
MLVLAGVLSIASIGASAETKPQRHTVTIEAMKYAPQTVEVSIGDIVIWKNLDMVPHTVTADSRAFDSGQILSDGMWEWKAKTKGIFSYKCTYHPTMSGTLIVK